jgi:rhomboid protease GluP
MAVHPAIVSVGASGAVFGVYGGLLGYLLRQRRAVPSEAVSRIGRGALLFIGFNVVFGLTQERVDMGAHLGGLAGGFVVGFALALPLTPDGGSRRLVRALVVALAGGLLVVGATQVVPAGDLARAFRAIERAAATESECITLLKARHADTDDPETLAAALEEQVLPKWRAAAVDLESFRDVPEPLGARVGTLLRYMNLRGRSWELYARALRTGDESLAAEATRLNQEAMGIAAPVEGDK